MATMLKAGPVVVLSEADDARAITARLQSSAGDVRWFANVEDLVQQQQLSSVSMLVFEAHAQPQGLLLVALGKMNLEYPAMQKVALLDEEPSLPVARYLTACGVDLICAPSDEERIDRLAVAVDRMQERTKWLS